MGEKTSWDNENSGKKSGLGGLKELKAGKETNRKRF
jgi:hypothetical protein